MLVVALVVAVALVLLRDDRQRADLDAKADQERPDRAAATSELLFQLQESLSPPDADGAAELADPDGAAELADPDVGSAAKELANLAANVRDLRVDRLSLRYLDVADLELSTGQRARFGPDAWISEVQLGWRFRGVDRVASTLEVPVVTDWEDDRAVFVTARVTGDYRVPLWFTESLAVSRGPGTLVLAGDARLARRLEAQGRTALATVRRTLPDFDGPLVIEAPDTPGDFRTAAGLTPAASRAIAAVTTTTDGSVLGRAPVHVYLNPDVFAPLGPVGRQIVVSHEATHVALGATMTDAPLWLSEGIADYVALVDTPLPDTVLAAQIRGLVRADGPPAALPGQAEFDGSNEDIGAWYEAAWLAVRLLGDTYGRQALLDFYEQVEADGDTRRAFREVLGTTEAAFLRAWQDELLSSPGRTTVAAQDGIDRRGAWFVLLGSAIVLLVVGAVLVPWDWGAGLTLDPPRAGDVFTQDQLREAESHAAALRLLSWSSYAISVVLALFLGLTRVGSNLFRRVAGGLRWWLAVPLGAFLLLLAGRLVTLPLALLAHDRNRSDGLTNQALGGWFTDRALSLLVSWALLSVLLLLFVGFARRSPRWWFAWCGAVLVGFTFFVSLLYPVVVEPLFNDFEPLADGPFKESVLQLADEQGVEVRDVLVSDASRRTTTLNAYVSGLGGTRRVVLYDNLLADATAEEALSVVAHELAHARHHDVVVGTGLGALGVVLGVAALALLLDASPVRRRAGVRGPADPAAVAVMAAFITLGGLVSSPVENAVSRAIEARADVTALRATDDPEAFRAVQRRLAERSLADPTPPWLGYVWFASHPTVLQRLAVADAVERAAR